MRVRFTIGVLVATIAVFAATPFARAGSTLADSPMGAAQLVDIAVEVNPAVRAARARWMAAMHSIEQNYAPADPVLGYANVDSPTNGFSGASLHSLTVSESFQFPGKAFLQADSAKRNAAIAHLQYEAAIRDVRAQVETAYYQSLLDRAMLGVANDTAKSLGEVLKVAQVAYSAGRVTQTDFISAEFDLAAAKQQERQLRTAEANDETALNQLLDRAPESPLDLDNKIDLTAFRVPLDKLTQMAVETRQEILEAALAEHNSQTALELAKLEYAPDYTVSYTFDDYLVSSFAPSPTHTQDHGFAINFNVPLFFWIKQNEDVKRSRYDLEAARDDLGSVRNQTAAIVTTLYRNAQLAYHTARLYRDSLIPLANQDLRVALVAYESGKISFVELTGALQRRYSARVAYLQAANQFLATQVALEQAIGKPLSP